MKMTPGLPKMPENYDKSSQMPSHIVVTEPSDKRLKQIQSAKNSKWFHAHSFIACFVFSKVSEIVFRSAAPFCLAKHFPSFLLHQNEGALFIAHFLRLNLARCTLKELFIIFID